MRGGDATRMIGAELLKLRRQRGLIITTAVLTVGVIIIGLIVTAALHANDPSEFGPVGGRDAYYTLMSGAAFYMVLGASALAASAGGSDVRAGVFRDLVATGRSRITLFGVRYPAILVVAFAFTALAVALATIAGFLGADGTTALSMDDVARWSGFYALAVAFSAAVGLGIGALFANASVSTTVVVAWLLIAGPLLGAASFLGPLRHVVSINALERFRPLGADEVLNNPGLGRGTAAVIVAGWIVLSLAAGAWRTRMRDA